jgi:hypothetical protein
VRVLRFILRLLAVLVVGLAAEAAYFYFELQRIPVPMGYEDIQHKDDYERLINITLPTAKAVLERDNDLPQPIAFGLEMNDQMAFLEPQGNSTLDSIQLIIRDFKQAAHAGLYRATAIAYDTVHYDSYRAPFDAIEFRYEHVGGDYLRGWVRYIKKPDGTYWYGLVHMERQPAVVFSRHNIEFGDED